MRQNFTTGMIIGGMVGASLSMLTNNQPNMNRTRKKMMRTGKDIFRKSSRVISDIADLMR